MAYFSDLVRDTTTTTGTGDVTVTGTAPTGRVAFGTAFTTGTMVSYTISSASGSEWETGLAPLSTSTTIQRSSTQAEVLASSNANALVSFSAGTKDVYCSLPAYFANSFTKRARLISPTALVQG